MCGFLASNSFQKYAHDAPSISTCGKNVVKVWQKCGRKLEFFCQKLYNCENKKFCELEFFKLKKLILLILSVLTLLSTVSTGFASEISEPSDELSEFDHLDEYEPSESLEFEEDEADIPDGWYDPEYGSLEDQTLESITITPIAELNDVLPIAAFQENEQITTVRRTGVIVRDNVPMREASSTTSRTIRTLSADTNVRITGRLGNKYRIRHASTTGWVSRDEMIQTRQTAIVRNNNVAVRASRNNQARQVTTVNSGQRLNVTHRTASWSRVTVNNQTGWIRNNQLGTPRGRRPGQARVQTQLHAHPDAGSNVRLDLSANQEFMILQRTVNGTGIHHGWTQIVIRHNGGTETGWIRTAHVQRRNQVRRVINGSAPFRTGPGSSHGRHNRARSINNNTQVTVLAEIGNWSHVRVQINGRNETGWIANSRLSRINLDLFDALLEYGQNYLGRPWTAGGNSPTAGFDCSGFIQWIYSVHDIALPRTAQQQFNSATSVTRSNARPGDLVFFEKTYNSRNRITHVGMYVGGGRMLHVGSSGGVQFSSATSGWCGNHFVGFGRVIG